MDKNSKTTKKIHVGKDSALSSEEIADRISSIEKRTGKDLEKMPVYSGTKIHPLKTLRDFYAPTTKDDVPRKAFNTVTTPALSGLLVSLLMDSSKGDFYFPSVNSVHISGKNKKPGVLEHEVGHWLDYNNKRERKKDSLRKAVNPVLRRELRATLNAGRELPPSTYNKNKDELMRALSTYSVVTGRKSPFPKRYVKKNRKRSANELSRNKSVKENREILKNLMTHAMYRDAVRPNRRNAIDDKGKIVFNAPENKKLMESLINKL